jgi:ubiquinone/menaquinone biosynthesis C-methylase UbiE
MITRSSVLRFFSSASASVSTKSDIENLEQYWERGLPWYNIMNTQLSLKAYKTLAPFLRLDKAKKVLEIGGGTGAGASVLIPHLAPSSTYVLTDHIECFLKVARSRNLPNTEIINCLPSALPFSGESFDRFIALATIEELDTTKKILQEAYRVLQPKGLLSASITGKRESDSYRFILEKVKTKFKISSGLKFRRELKDVRLLTSMFEAAGFSRLYKFYENVYYASDDIEELKNFYLQEPSIAEQDSDKKQEISAYLDKVLNELIRKEGVPVGTDYLFILAYKE